MRLYLLILSLCLTAPAWPQVCTTAQTAGGWITISDTIRAPGGGNFTGWQDMAIAYSQVLQNQTVTGAKMSIRITSGIVNLCLAPGTYSITRRQDSPQYFITANWFVPYTGGPYKVVDVEQSAVNIIYTNGITWFSLPVTAQQNQVIPRSQHHFPNNNLIVLCDGLGECGQVNISSTGTVTVTSSTAWTGTVWIGTGRTYTISFTNATTAAAELPVHGLNDETLIACYDASGNEFGMGAVTATPHDTGIGGAQGYDFSVNFGVTPETGTCVLIGN